MSHIDWTKAESREALYHIQQAMNLLGRCSSLGSGEQDVIEALEDALYESGIVVEPADDENGEIVFDVWSREFPYIQA